MINSMLETLSVLIKENMWIAPVLALVAGILTSLTPCALSGIPLVIGYVGGAGSNNTKKAFMLSLIFAAGSAVTLTALGAAASMLGKLAGASSSLWYIVLGVLMVLMALQMYDIYNFMPQIVFMSKSTKKGYIGAFAAGILGGVFSSPCATPVLVALLSIVARSGNTVWGILLLLIYSVGHSFLVLIAGTSIGFVKRLSASGKYGVFAAVLKYVMGTAILLLAFYMFYLGF